MDRRDKLREEFAKLLEAVNSHTIDMKAARGIMTERQFEQFYDGYLEYLGDNSYKVTDEYENSDACDQELWHKMMKAWLDTSHPEKLAPVAKMKKGTLPTWEQFQGEES